MVPVELTVEHRGNLWLDELDQGCACDQDRCTCEVEVAEGTEIEVRAIPTDKDFEKWLTSNCDGQDATCTLTVELPRTEVGARFHD